MLNITFTKAAAQSALSRGTKAAGRVRAVLLAIALGAAAACTPQPTGTCSDPTACAIVKGTAGILQSDMGTDYGAGVILRDVRAVGQTLLVDVGLPLPVSAFSQPLGKGVLSTFATAFASSFCEGPNAGEFFELGADIRLRGFSNDRTLVSDQVIKSCGGK